MGIFQCKMCGGTLNVDGRGRVAVCEYCGMKQTLPKDMDDKLANMYERANYFRRCNEFDKAADLYNQILIEDSTDAETYWSLVLCRFGVEYVEDPIAKKHIPTVNRAQFTSIFDDDNYRLALKYADANQRQIYEEEAKQINEIQKGILEISNKEEPFDIFICYKETDANGRRTQDSVLAQDLYYQLSQEGFKVFFSRITLEDKLGSAYEPYIFAALNSAKVMVALGTRSEHFNAVWVKNEWSRYLSLIKQGEKKVLIPAYRDMDPYNLPEEFSHLQAQDMSKLGFMQDLLRGIKKILQDNPIQKETATFNEPKAIKVLYKKGMGRFKGGLLTGFGFGSLCMAAIGGLVSIGTGFGSDDIIGISVFSVIGALLLFFGIRSKKLAAKSKQYIPLIVNGKRYLEDIANSTGNKYYMVKKDIQKLIDKKILKNAYIDEAKKEIVIFERKK